MLSAFSFSFPEIVGDTPMSSEVAQSRMAISIVRFVQNEFG
jgi:hypothetical protein